MRALLTVALLIAAAPIGAQDDGCRERVSAVADAFGRALQGDGELRPLLPARGKVRLHLARLGSEDGFFSSGQVDALLRDFLTRGAVRGFTVDRVQAERDDCIAVVTCSVALTDRDGRPADVDLRLAIHPEGRGWVVREIRESRR